MNKTYSVSYLGITNGELGVLTQRHKLEPTPPPSEKYKKLNQSQGTSRNRLLSQTSNASQTRDGVASIASTTRSHEELPGSFSLRAIVKRPRPQRPSTADSMGRSEASSPDLSAPIAHRPTYSEVKDVISKSMSTFLNEDEEASFTIEDDYDNDEAFERSMGASGTTAPPSSRGRSSRPGTRGSTRPWSAASSEQPLPSRLTSDVYAQEEGFKHTGHETIAHKLPARGFSNTTKPPARTLRMKRLKKRATMTEAPFSAHAAMRGLKIKQKARPVPRSLAQVYKQDKPSKTSVPFALAGEPAPAIKASKLSLDIDKMNRKHEGDGSGPRDRPLTMAETRRHVTQVLSARDQMRRNAKATRQYLRDKPRISPRSGVVTVREQGNLAAPKTADTFHPPARKQPASSRFRSQRPRTTVPQCDHHGRPLSSPRASPRADPGMGKTYPDPHARAETRLAHTYRPSTSETGRQEYRGQRAATARPTRPKSARKELFIQYLLFKRLRDDNARLTAKLEHGMASEPEPLGHSPVDIDTVLTDTDDDHDQYDDPHLLADVGSDAGDTGGSYLYLDREVHEDDFGPTQGYMSSSVISNPAPSVNHPPALPSHPHALRHSYSDTGVRFAEVVNDAPGIASEDGGWQVDDNADNDDESGGEAGFPLDVSYYDGQAE